MKVLHLVRRLARSGPILAATLCLTWPGMAQDASPQSEGQKAAKSRFSTPWNLVGPYSAGQVVPETFRNTARVEGLLREGKLFLSMSDALALGLENNLDLVASRYDLPIADAGVMRARGGGGTSPAFDPTLSLETQIERANAPEVINGTVTQNTGTANVSYNQGFALGTNLSVGFQNRRYTTSAVPSLIPLLNSSLRFTLTQPLLQGFGVSHNRRQIRIARNNRQAADLAFKEQVISVVSQIQNIYWNLVSAYEDVKVKQESVALAQQTLDNTREQVKVGTFARVELARWESQVASAQQDLIAAQTVLRHQEHLMKTAISRDLTDPALVSASIVPTDTMSLPEEEPVIPTEDLISAALKWRPDLGQSQIDLLNRGITKKAQRNALLPTLDLITFYGSSAAGDDSMSYGSVFGNLFSANRRDKGVGFSLQVPLRNRAARADQMQGELEYRQAETRLHLLQNQIRSDVRDAQFAMTQNRARVEAGRKAVAYARESLEAEQAKYAAGMSTSVSVLQSQRDLTQAQSNLIGAMAAYEKSHVDLDQLTGMTLTKSSIDILDAQSGRIGKLPFVPGVVPAN